MRLATVVCAAVAAAGIGSVALPANAYTFPTLIYDDVFYGLNSQGSDPYSPNGLGPLAQSFTTSIRATYLDETGVVLINPDGDAPNGDVGVYLFSDNAGEPGTQVAELGSVSDSKLTANPQLFKFDADIFLAANTRYWIELIGSNGSIGQWERQLPGDYSDTTSVEYYYNRYGTFADTQDTRDGVGPLGPYQMFVDANLYPPQVSSAPEPSFWALLFSAVATVGTSLRVVSGKSWRHRHCPGASP